MKRTIIVFAVVLLATVYFTGAVVATENSSGSASVMIARAEANLIVENIVIRKLEDMNFRVRVKNIGEDAARNLTNNLKVTLSVKNEETGEWILLKEWQNIDKILPGQTVSRDFFESAGSNPNLEKESFTLKAEISLQNPGGIVISQASLTRSYPQDAVENP